MDQSQIADITKIILLFGILLTTGGVAIGVGGLMVVHNALKAARNDAPLIAAINHLYNSVPSKTQEIVKEVGDDLSEAGGLIGDVTKTVTTTTTTAAPAIPPGPNA